MEEQKNWGKDRWGRGSAEFEKWQPKNNKYVQKYLEGKVDLDRFAAKAKDDKPEWNENLGSGGDGSIGIDSASSSDRIITGYDYDRIEKNYDTDGQGILKKEYDAGKDGTEFKNRWKRLFGEDTCAVKLSWALNHAGYYVPDETSIQGRLPYTSNINPNHNYILGADEMGGYLLRTLGAPTLKSKGPINSDNELEDFMKEVEKWENYGGIIYFDAHNQKEYEASGHVDLLYEDWGNDAHIYGLDQELDDYIDWRNGDLFNSDSQLEVYIWLLKGNFKK